MRVGLIGAGGIATAAHLPGWEKVQDAEVVAVADIRKSLAQAVADQYGIPHVFTDYKDLIRQDLDAVDICVPNQLHTPIVLAALRAGRHVLCEKPLAVTTAEIRQMGRAADAKGLILMTGQHMRFLSHSQAVKRWAETGALGEVYHARVRAMRRAFLPPLPSFLDPRLSGGGPCMDIGVHALDCCLWVMGDAKPVRVTGTTKNNFGKTHIIPGMWGEWDREQMNVEDFAAGFVHFDNGATMTVECSWLGHQEEKEDLSWQLFGAKSGVQWPSLKYSSALNGIFLDGTLMPAKEDILGHHAEIAASAEAILKKLPSPVPWTQSLRVTAILEAIYKSATQEREIRIQY